MIEQVKTMTATEFRAKCFAVLDDLPRDGLVITRRGRAVARIYPEPVDMMQFCGSIPGLIVEGADIFSTGIKWEAES